MTRQVEAYILLTSIWGIPSACGPLLQLATAQAGQGNSSNWCQRNIGLNLTCHPVKFQVSQVSYFESASETNQPRKGKPRCVIPGSKVGRHLRGDTCTAQLLLLLFPENNLLRFPENLLRFPENLLLFPKIRWPPMPKLRETSSGERARKRKRAMAAESTGLSSVWAVQRRRRRCRRRRSVGGGSIL